MPTRRKVTITMTNAEGGEHPVDFIVSDAWSSYERWLTQPGNKGKSEEEYVESLKGYVHANINGIDTDVQEVKEPATKPDWVFTEETVNAKTFESGEEAVFTAKFIDLNKYGNKIPKFSCEVNGVKNTTFKSSGSIEEGYTLSLTLLNRNIVDETKSVVWFADVPISGTAPATTYESKPTTAKFNKGEYREERAITTNNVCYPSYPAAGKQVKTSGTVIDEITNQPGVTGITLTYGSQVREATSGEDGKWEAPTFTAVIGTNTVRLKLTNGKTASINLPVKR